MSQRYSSSSLHASFNTPLCIVCQEAAVGEGPFSRLHLCQQHMAVDVADVVKLERNVRRRLRPHRDSVNALGFKREHLGLQQKLKKMRHQFAELRRLFEEFQTWVEEHFNGQLEAVQKCIDECSDIQEYVREVQEARGCGNLSLVRDLAVGMQVHMGEIEAAFSQAAHLREESREIEVDVELHLEKVRRMLPEELGGSGSAEIGVSARPETRDAGVIAKEDCETSEEPIYQFPIDESIYLGIPIDESEPIYTYNPYNYGPTSMSSWFDVDSCEAEKRLLMPGLQEGTYLLRPGPMPDAYCLSIRTPKRERAFTGLVSGVKRLVLAAGQDEATDGKQVVVKHYMIRALDSGGFYINANKKFPSMQNLVDHYKSDKAGLCAPLTHPCPRNYVPPAHFRDFELNRKQLTMVCKLGNGSFGEVWKAKIGKLVEVAVKQMITNSQGFAMKKEEFIREAETMHKLHHPKLVQLIGVCTHEEPFYIVTELMPNGALLSYLRTDNKNGRKITFTNMLDMMFQIADGMAYLEERKFIHRDLRAANILVGQNNIVKVADFGLSRIIEESEYEVTESTQFPIRWTAPEAATTNWFTTKSDVWSFGILIYEIVTRGGSPYPEYNNAEILRMVSEGYRMPKPNRPEFGMECDDFLYENIMLYCWKATPADRPTFAVLRDIFESYDEEKESPYLVAI